MDLNVHAFTQAHTYAHTYKHTKTAPPFDGVSADFTHSMVDLHLNMSKDK